MEIVRCLIDDGDEGHAHQGVAQRAEEINQQLKPSVRVDAVLGHLVGNSPVPSLTHTLCLSLSLDVDLLICRCNKCCFCFLSYREKKFFWIDKRQRTEKLVKTRIPTERPFGNEGGEEDQQRDDANLYG